jgi:hypothetical protein
LAAAVWDHELLVREHAVWAGPPPRAFAALEASLGAEREPAGVAHERMVRRRHLLRKESGPVQLRVLVIGAGRFEGAAEPADAPALMVTPDMEREIRRAVQGARVTTRVVVPRGRYAGSWLRQALVLFGYRTK